LGIAVTRVVFITGASSGIGRATALACAKAGYHVVGTARRAARLDALAQEIDQLEGDHGDFLAIAGDVRAADALQSAITQAVDRFERLDVLIANAGVGHRGAFVDSGWDEIETLLRVNIDGVLHSVRFAVPEMRKSGGGHVITISSIAYNLVSPNAAVYAASKAFVTSMANSLRLELAKDDIYVTDFLLGRTETEFNSSRLGEGARKTSSLPVMPAEQVAASIVDVIQNPRPKLTLRPIDRLIVLANRLFPNVVGWFAKREYQ
jgi:short-subunit dehydrogenase